MITPHGYGRDHAEAVVADIDPQNDDQQLNDVEMTQEFDVIRDDR
ncbi:hypothetical protein [Lentzea guizhouensis]|nr:hypothetical protein [Lentzea guizhouensis]